MGLTDQGVELWLFGHLYHARYAGFSPSDGRHLDDPSMLAWWPARGAMVLRGVHPTKVVETDSFKHPNVGDQMHAEVMAHLEHRPPKIWMRL